MSLIKICFLFTPRIGKLKVCYQRKEFFIYFNTLLVVLFIDDIIITFYQKYASKRSILLFYNLSDNTVHT